ncbi:type II secretion system GspH family protein [Akkermansiaceae bacterium]|nr:type II secretion system GspH family protein [Akkermansiaceae bacterium]
MKLYPRISRRSGFTLIELLVVIAIVAVLAFFVVIGVRKGFAAANAAKVNGNMKGIYTIMMNIVSEGTETGYHPPGSFPPHSGVLANQESTSFVWWDLVADKAEIANRDSGRYEWTEPYSNTLLQNPLSRKKLGAGLTEYHSLYGNNEVSRGGYAYNGNLGSKSVPDSNEENAYVIRQIDVADESTTIFFAESNDDDTGEGWVFDTIQQVPQGNYKDSVHCCFIDGHIETIKNKVINRTATFDFYTSVEEKDYDNQPGGD